MADYLVRGVTAATAATVDHAVCGLWNPAGGRRIKVWRFAIYKTAAGTAADGIRLERTSAQGTVGSSVTPDSDHALESDAAPDSGAILGLAAYSSQPTFVATSTLYGWVAPSVAGAGIDLIFRKPIVIPPGTGLGWRQRTATAWPISEVTFDFED